jgi:hypothetical protein
VTPGNPPPLPQLALLAAELCRRAEDHELYVAFLLNTLTALPADLVTVRHEGRLRARLSGRRPAVVGATVRLGNRRFELDRTDRAVGGRSTALIRHESGGIVLSTRSVGLDEWSRELADALGELAARDAGLAAAIERLTF